MIIVEITVQVPERAVIGAVLRLTIEALFVGAPMSFIDFVVKSPVRPVIPSMLAIIIVVVMS